MLRTTSGSKGRQRASARRRFPNRRLHLIDIENLADDPLPSLSQVRTVHGLYADCLAFGAMDQVEVASSHLALINAAAGWPRAHYRVRSGPDGADLALLDVLQHENISRRFTHVAIGSGDHLFAEEAARLADQGVWVTVVSRQRSLSSQLALAARDVIFLDARGRGCLMHTHGQPAAAENAARQALSQGAARVPADHDPGHGRPSASGRSAPTDRDGHTQRRFPSSRAARESCVPSTRPTAGRPKVPK